MMDLNEIMSSALELAKPVERASLTEQDKQEAARLMIDAGYMPYDKPAFLRLVGYLAHKRQGTAGRGLLMLGTPGNGKTMWMNKFSGCRVWAAQELVDVYNDSIEAAKGIVWPEAYQRENAGYRDLAIDDLGTEPAVNVRYGTKENVIQILLEHRYNMFTRNPSSKLYLSANLPEDELKDRYGLRVWSRLHEMCTIVPFTAEDHRTKG